MVAQILARVFAALADALVLVGEPCAALVDDVALHRHVQKRAELADALAIDDIKLGHLERRSHLVFNHLDLGAVADHLRSVLELLSPPHIQAHARIELERAAAGGGFGVAVHHAHLFAQLVNEDGHGIGLGDDAR